MEVDRFYAQLGRRIQQARTKAHLNQQQLAQSLELSRTSVTNIERGRQRLQVHHLVRVAGVLGVPVDTLLSGLLATPQSDELPAKAQELEASTRKWVERVASRSRLETKDDDGS